MKSKSPKKIPQRMCTVCRQMFAKTDLLRLVIKEDGFVTDAKGKLPGRGLYLCKSEACESKFFNPKQTSKILKRKVSEDECEILKQDVILARQAQAERLKLRQNKKMVEEKRPVRIVKVKIKDE